MENEIFSEKTRKLLYLWKEVLMIGVLFGLIFFSINSFLPIKYEADASILIVQKNAVGLDAYKEVKSAEFVGKIISEVMLSNSFMEGVVAKNEKAKQIIYKESNFEDRLDKWQDSLSINQVSNTGALNLSFYSDNKESSYQILSTIIDVLKNDGEKYHGNTDIGIKVINNPYYLNDPASLGFIASFLGGFIFGIALILVMYQLLGDSLLYFIWKNFSFRKKTTA